MPYQDSKFSRYPTIVKAIAEFVRKLFPNLEVDLEQANLRKSPREYVIERMISVFYLFLILIFLSIIFLMLMHWVEFFLIALLIIFCVTIIIFFRSMLAPRYIAQKRVRSIENNLIPALRSMRVQLDAGIPLFDVLVSVSKGNYGELSKIFEEAVQRIGSGKPQIGVLEELSRKNPSLFFRRAIWQITNSLTSGGDIAEVMEEVTDFLSNERFFEIQVYGSKLRALVMFYMLVVVILPSLGITFLVIILSLVGASPQITTIVFVTLEFFIFFIQVMFFGVIKSTRPNLIRE